LEKFIDGKHIEQQKDIVGSLVVPIVEQSKNEDGVDSKAKCENKLEP